MQTHGDRKMVKLGDGAFFVVPDTMQTIVLPTNTVLSSGIALAEQVLQVMTGEFEEGDPPKRGATEMLNKHRHPASL